MSEKIKTNFVYPPIPTRNFDWCATFEDYEPGSLIGYGATEEDAIKDLKEQKESEAYDRDRNQPGGCGGVGVLPH